jgi:hypothetical protein
MPLRGQNVDTKQLEGKNLDKKQSIGGPANNQFKLFKVYLYFI